VVSVCGRFWLRFSGASVGGRSLALLKAFIRVFLRFLLVYFGVGREGVSAFFGRFLW
jgi:hypothetical protein